MTHDLGRAVNQEDEEPECAVTKTRYRAAALKFLTRLMEQHGSAAVIVKDNFCCGDTIREMNMMGHESDGRWIKNRTENTHLPFRRGERAMQRFRRMRSLQKAVSVHDPVYNHINQQRKLFQP